MRVSLQKHQASTKISAEDDLGMSARKYQILRSSYIHRTMIDIDRGTEMATRELAVLCYCT